ncbi:MAG TPA: DUF1343 domain-containing protein [Methylomirabilota bacterium]|jgi:uncharacterized protein YbbC (DUF1343 family)|nr:DUF1343 domain-containing protein [Methylomirabilota bacterium]
MSSVRCGLDVLVGRRQALLRGRRVGLLCHQASVTRDLRHAADAIGRLRGVRLVALFAPEHGLAGAAQDHARVGQSRDRARGLPVRSLYDRRLAPSEAMLRDIDTLVVDLQDVGSRYYTFVWTMALAMGACARARLPVVVLDRPNPLGGLMMEGNLPDPRFASFVGLYPLPVRHAMTIAELAAYLNDAHRIGCDLTVVPMAGWRRAMSWHDTGLPWVAPSPNMPTPDTARVYPGGCLIEGTNLSEGRGTTRPFELVGAPFLDGRRLADGLARRELPGVGFRPAAFEPAFHKYKGELCEGVQLHVTDAERFKPFATYLALIIEARRQAPRRFRWRRPPYEFETRRLPIDLLCGGDTIRHAVEGNAPLAGLEHAWRRDLARFARRRRPYLLYR